MEERVSALQLSGRTRTAVWPEGSGVAAVQLACKGCLAV